MRSETGYPLAMTRALALAFTLLAVPAAAQSSRAGDGGAPAWDPTAAAAYLDARMDMWFANATKLKTGDTQTACVSCHAGLAYALSRPVLRRVMHSGAPPPQEARLLDETIRRVDTYATHQVLYDFNERRQIESRGTDPRPAYLRKFRSRCPSCCPFGSPRRTKLVISGSEASDIPRNKYGERNRPSCGVHAPEYSSSVR